MLGAKIDIDNLVLPELDIVRAVPINIPVDDKRIITFRIPSIENYFMFETLYLKILVSHFLGKTKINLLSYADFESLELKKMMFSLILEKMQSNQFKKDTIEILKKYFTANFNLNKSFKILNPIFLSYLFLFMHKVIETVKKKFLEVIKTVDQQIVKDQLKPYSMSLKSNSTKIEPRY